LKNAKTRLWKTACY